MFNVGDRVVYVGLKGVVVPGIKPENKNPHILWEGRSKPSYHGSQYINLIENPADYESDFDD